MYGIFLLEYAAGYSVSTDRTKGKRSVKLKWLGREELR
jgi:hypothetical protein